LTLRRYSDAGKLRAIVLSKRMIRFSIDEVLRVEREAAE
jgi:predicted site-specific integrase-resolvase